MRNKLFAAILLALCLCLFMSIGALASSGEAKYTISIAAPRYMNVTPASVMIRVEDVNGTGFAKAEVKHGENGDWQDITGSLRTNGWAVLDVSYNGTVYAAVTDMAGTVHVKSQYIDGFDRDAPAALSEQASQPVGSQPTQSAASVVMEKPTPAENPSAMPTDGAGTVIENNVKAPGEREFFTITTERGNDFYIVVDKEKPENNVYLLSEVTEEGLLGLTKQSSSSKPTPEPEPLPAPVPDPVDPTPEPQLESQKSTDGGTVWLIILVVLAAGGAAYYFKIVRPKQNIADPYEDDDEGFPDDEDEEIDLSGDDYGQDNDERGE